MIFMTQTARRASTIIMRDARIAGSTPPTKPITSANTMPIVIILKFREKLKASSEKVWKFIVDMVMSCMKEAKKSPTSPPKKPRNNDSRRNAIRISLLLNPSARRVPISAVRLATAEYIVIIAPIIAPIEKIMVREIPKILRNFAMISDWSA